MNFFRKNLKHYIIMIAIVVAFVFFDQITKIVLDGKDIAVINNFFWFASVHNTGAAYGMFAGSTAFLIIFSIVMICAFLIFDKFQKNKTVFYSISMSLLISGAVGNLIDRLIFSYVRDFIKFSFFSFTFNIADACLTIGTIMIFIFLLFLDRKKAEVSDNGN